MHPIDEFETAIGLRGAIYVEFTHPSGKNCIAGNLASQEMLRACGLKATGKFDYEWLLQYVSPMGYCLETDSD